jgi:putative cell wall-binding protein
MVTLYDGAVSIGSATAAGGNWSITASVLSEGGHTVTAKATDLAGNTGAASAGLSLTIDTTTPTATVAVADASLKADETTTVTFTFSEVVTGFTNDDLTVSGGTLTPVSSSDGGVTYTATFTPAADTEDATNTIDLNLAGVTDAAGNAGSGSVSSNNYGINTTAPTYTASADPAGKTFTAATVGYGQQGAQEFTIENTGTGTITNLSAALGGTDFEISAALSADTLNAGGTATVSVRPKTGLAVNTYTDTLTITGDNGISLTVNLSFTVNVASTDKTLVSITAPADITGVANGTEKTASALGLPSTVTLVTDDGNVSANVSWDVASSSYNVSSSSTQTFMVNGTVTLPAGVINPDNVSLSTSISVTVNAGSNGGGNNNGGGAPPTPATPDYKADVKEGNSPETTLPVTVNQDTGTASIDAGSQQPSPGGTVITAPAIPDVNTYSVGIAVPELSTNDVQGTLIVNTNNGSVTVPSNMLTGVAGISGSKAEISIGQGNKDSLPEDVKAAVGDRPLISLSLSIDGKQTDWSNPGVPVTVSIPYTPTAEELLSSEHLTVWYIDGSGNAVRVEGGHYDSASGTVIFDTTHFSYYAVVYDPIIRLSGTDRIDTALRIAQATYPGRITSAVLVTAGNYPDALAGSTLAYQLKAPVLLVGSSEADQVKVLDYLKANLEPEGTVYILGAAAVVSNGMENKIKSSGFGHITRIAGETRYDTAVKIVEQLNIKTGTPVVLVNGEDYPDALSVSSIAAQNQFPILLVPKDGINDAVSKEIVAIKPSKIYIIGLEGAISTAVESRAAGITGLAAEDIVRIGGADRYATSLAIAEYFNLESQTLCIATGNNFPDALAGSVYAAKTMAPIILTDSILPMHTADYVESRKPAELAIFGGEAVVGRDIEQKIKELAKI